MQANIYSRREPNCATAVTWSRVEDRIFENALVEFPEGLPDMWQKIADRLPGKSADDIMAHYDKLCRDIADIEAGLVPEPSYSELPSSSSSSSSKCKSKRSTCKRKKGEQWTPEEHLSFLRGLEVHEWGDWKNIARLCVKTREASQVASHAQKYKKRQEMDQKDRKRASIHDITIPTNMPMPMPMPIAQVPHHNNATMPLLQYANPPPNNNNNNINNINNNAMHMHVLQSGIGTSNNHNGMSLLESGNPNLHEYYNGPLHGRTNNWNTPLLIPTPGNLHQQ